MTLIHLIVQFLNRIFPAPGWGVRFSLFVLFVFEGLGYFSLVQSGRALTTSYQVQVEYAPLWAFGLAFLALGLALQLTMRRRHDMIGRSIPVFGFAVAVFMAVLYIISGGLTGSWRFGGMILLLLLELAHVDQGE